MTLELLESSVCEGLGKDKVRRAETRLIDGFCLLHLTHLRDIFLDLECSRPVLPSQEAPRHMHDLRVPPVNACHSRPRIPGKGKS